MAIYGNVKDNLKAPFVFDKIYPNRTTMDKKVNNDGVFINRYVLINYNAKIIDDQTGQLSFSEENIQENKNIDRDNDKYTSTYHLTAWLKVAINGTPEYILAGELQAKTPDLDVIIDAPSTTDTPFIDYGHSSNANYVLHIPRQWDITLSVEDNNNLNLAGFNELFEVKSTSCLNGISMTAIPSEANNYYTINYDEAIGLTEETYNQGQYYVKTSELQPYYSLAIEDFNPSTATTYFKKVYSATSSNEPDTKQFLIYAQSLGDSVADVYNVLYGLPRNDKRIGYSTTDNYATLPSDTCTYAVKISDTTYYLNEDDLKSLSHKNNLDIYPYAIYSTTAGARPYMKKLLFNYTNIVPYNNLTNDDSISVAWALEELKSYISELRYLVAESTTVTTGKGLLSDWTNNTENSFGYIHNRPQVISTTAIYNLWRSTTADSVIG